MAYVVKRQAKSGVRWDCHWVTNDGVHTSRAFRTRKEAEQHRAQVEADQSRGESLDTRKGRALFREFAEEWFASRKPTLSPRTAELYRHQLDRFLLPEFGGRQVGRITPTQIRSWYARLAASPTGRAGTPLSSASTAKIYRLLRQVMQQAVDDRVLRSNPVSIKGAAVERSAERQIATVDEVFAMADAMDDRYRALVLVAGFVGLRQGELWALRRRDVDMAVGVIRVERSLAELRDGTLLYKEPKSKAGRRAVTVPHAILPDLGDHLEKYVGPEPDALVFTGAKGAPLRAGNFGKLWGRAREQVGVPHLTFHDLRHTANTLAASAGASTRELMSRMGHASPQAALRYQHITEQRDHELARTLGGLIDDARSHARSDATTWSGDSTEVLDDDPADL